MGKEIQNTVEECGKAAAEAAAVVNSVPFAKIPFGGLFACGGYCGGFNILIGFALKFNRGGVFYFTFRLGSRFLYGFLPYRSGLFDLFFAYSAFKNGNRRAGILCPAPLGAAPGVALCFYGYGVSADLNPAALAGAIYNAVIAAVLCAGGGFFIFLNSFSGQMPQSCARTGSYTVNPAVPADLIKFGIIKAGGIFYRCALIPIVISLYGNCKVVAVTSPFSA